MPRSKKGHWKGLERAKRTKEEWEEMKKKNPELGQKSYKLSPRTNPTFEKFYQGIGIVPEEEWETFLETMRKDLPATFRITGSRSQAQELLKIIKGQYFSKFLGKEREGRKMEPEPIPWYPDELAWQLDITKKEIKNDNTLKSLHGFLISETESGNISRQEAVSMIPPLLLDIQPHHKILDMCAAPGSKTAQLIEMLHSDESQPIPEGFVVANDMDNKRCYLMTHQVKRIQSPNCMIINHDARILPNMLLSTEKDAEFLRYDRVLCDVPCSGDGTMRKNPDIWSKWHANGAYNLHRIQKKVLQRGLELLAVGGKLVYSTCSLNPVEDEAVILTLIKQCAGSVELLDVSDKLPGLKYCKGTYSWKILGSKTGIWYETVDQAPSQFQNAWDSTMYPPIITEAQEAKLERCIRILPHQQNTGAFFIAVLQKTKELPWSTANRKSDPVINTRLRLDPSEQKDPQSEHFSFGVRSGSGLYIHAKCNVCGVLLQGHNDYNSHKNGRRHNTNLKALQSTTENQSDPKANSDTTNSETEVNTSTEHSDDVQKGSKIENISEKKELTENVPKDKDSETENILEKKEFTENVQTEKDSETENISEKKDLTENAQTEKGSETPANGEACQGVKEGTAEEQKGEEGAPEASSGSVVDTEGPKDTEEAEKDTECGPPPPKKSRREKQREKEQETGEYKVVMQGHKEDPFYFCGKQDPIWPQIKKFYDISDDMNLEQIMYRNMKRVLYFVSQPIRRLVLANDFKVKFINLGVKCFSYAPSPVAGDCDYRLSQDGLLAIERYIRGRRVNLTKQDLITILSNENPFICKLSVKAQDDVYSMGPGSTLFQFKPSESDPDPNVEIVFCGWRGKTSVRSFVGKDERSHYLRMCGVELTDIQARVQAEKAAKAAGTGPFPSMSGTETPVGVASGDEEEVKQWNVGDGDTERGMEVDDMDENGSQEVTGDNLGAEDKMEFGKGEVEEGKGSTREEEKEDLDGDNVNYDDEEKIKEEEGIDEDH